MRILNVDLILCDRCAKRFELSRDQDRTGYGTLVLRAMRAERVGGNLSGREEEILALICQGLPNKSIARSLDLAEATVKVHLKSILRKTRCRNRTQVAMLTRSETARHGPEKVTAAVEMTADLCEGCVEELRVFMRNGSSEAKQVAA